MEPSKPGHANPSSEDGVPPALHRDRRWIFGKTRENGHGDAEAREIREARRLLQARPSPRSNS
uniref:Uncharacterized protein n=1 Tax=Leersia perrieri TaxID=77586 RepID=A0A0D9V7X6_9ORYZ